MHFLYFTIGGDDASYMLYNGHICYFEASFLPFITRVAAFTMMRQPALHIHICWRRVRDDAAMPLPAQNITAHLTYRQAFFRDAGSQSHGRTFHARQLCAYGRNIAFVAFDFVDFSSAFLLMMMSPPGNATIATGQRIKRAARLFLEECHRRTAMPSTRSPLLAEIFE